MGSDMVCEHYINSQIYMRGKTEHKVPAKLTINVETSASITDYQYNHNGTQLAVADSDGTVYLYTRHGEHLQKTSQFKGDDAAIWKLAWADPSLGDVIAIGSFKKKVAVFQNKGNVWSEVAFHEIHEGSVNHVEWASPAFGVKLFSAGNDGSVGILELKKGAWTSTSFSAHECSINSLSLRPLALNEEEEERQNAYPLLATVGKDHVVKVWRHTSEVKEELLEKDARIYQQVASCKPHSETVRTVLWKKRWVEAEPIEYELLTASEDGTVKLASFKDDKQVESVEICRHESAVYRISQSITGNLISASVDNEQQRTYVYTEKGSWRQWSLAEQIR